MRTRAATIAVWLLGGLLPLIASAGLVTQSGARYYPPAADGGGPALTHCVDSATGDDSRNYATVEGSAGTLCWETLGRAVWGSTNRASPNAGEAIAAGDVLYVTGDQDLTSVQCDNSLDVWFSPVNEGSAGNPIIIWGVSRPEIRITDSSAGILIGTAGRDYIEWHGFRIDEQAPPIGDSGPAGLIDTVGSKIVDVELIGVGWPFESFNNGTYHEIRPAVNVSSSTAATPTVLTTATHGRSDGDAIRVAGVTGVTNGDYYVDELSATTLALYTDNALTTPVAGAGGAAGGTIRKLRQDNYMGVFVVSAYEVEISDSLIGNYIGYGENASSILSYYSFGMTIESNDLYGNEGFGIFFKGMSDAARAAHQDGHGPTIVRYNYIHDSDQGGIDVGDIPATASNPVLIYQNLLKNSGRSVQILPLTTDANSPRHIKVVNNTMADSTAGFVPRFAYANAAYEHYNNIYFDVTYPVQPWNAADLVATEIDGDRNNASGHTAYALVEPEGANDSYTLPDFKTAFTFIDENTTTTAPNFVDEIDYVPQAGALATLGEVVFSICGTNGATIPVGIHCNGTQPIGPQ